MALYNYSCADLLLEVLKGERVGTLDGQAEGATPNLSGSNTEGSGDAEKHGVVVVLRQTVVHKKGARAGVHVGPRVADLASLGELLGNDLVVGLHEVNKVITLDVLFGELKLANETRVRLTEDSMTVAGHNLAGLESLIDEVSDVLLGPVVAVLLLESQDEVEALLVGETVQRTSKTIHTGRERQVRVGQSGADQVRRVCRNISTFVITRSKESIKMTKAF